jgi:tetratricopeptide (TPR) repeat protein
MSILPEHFLVRDMIMRLLGFNLISTYVTIEPTVLSTPKALIQTAKGLNESGSLQVNTCQVPMNKTGGLDNLSKGLGEGNDDTAGEGPDLGAKSYSKPFVDNVRSLICLLRRRICIVRYCELAEQLRVAYEGRFEQFCRHLLDEWVALKEQYDVQPDTQQAEQAAVVAAWLDNVSPSHCSGKIFENEAEGQILKAIVEFEVSEDLSQRTDRTHARARSSGWYRLVTMGIILIMVVAGLLIPVWFNFHSRWILRKDVLLAVNQRQYEQAVRLGLEFQRLLKSDWYILPSDDYHVLSQLGIASNILAGLHRSLINAEVAFKANEFKEARRIYEQIIESSPVFSKRLIDERIDEISRAEWLMQKAALGEAILALKEYGWHLVNDIGTMQLSIKDTQKVYHSILVEANEVIEYFPLYVSDYYTKVSAWAKRVRQSDADAERTLQEIPRVTFVRLVQSASWARLAMLDIFGTVQQHYQAITDATQGYGAFLDRTRVRMHYWARRLRKSIRIVIAEPTLPDRCIRAERLIQDALDRYPKDIIAQVERYAPEFAEAVSKRDVAHTFYRDEDYARALVDYETALDLFKRALKRTSEKINREREGLPAEIIDAIRMIDIGLPSRCSIKEHMDPAQVRKLIALSEQLIREDSESIQWSKLLEWVERKGQLYPELGQRYQFRFDKERITEIIAEQEKWKQLGKDLKNVTPLADRVKLIRHFMRDCPDSIYFTHARKKLERVLDEQHKR